MNITLFESNAIAGTETTISITLPKYRADDSKREQLAARLRRMGGDDFLQSTQPPEAYMLLTERTILGGKVVKRETQLDWTTAEWIKTLFSNLQLLKIEDSYNARYTCDEGHCSLTVDCHDTIIEIRSKNNTILFEGCERFYDFLAATLGSLAKAEASHSPLIENEPSQ